jgi:transposase InsO family protein
VVRRGKPGDGRFAAQSPQTNGICERFHKTILNEFRQVAFRKKIYSTMEELQADLDAWIYSYNHERESRENVLWANADSDVRR